MEVLVIAPSAQFWRGKRVLLTGHTGFKGAWLALWLQRLGAEVTGIALEPPTTPSLFALARVVDGLHHRVGDLRDAAVARDAIAASRPQIVLHLAAQALVSSSYAQPLATFATNVMGTAHVLDALRGATDARVVVVVTTDKVYRNREWRYPYREDDALGGHDPYSASKAAAELVTASYRDAFLASQGLGVATARAGNVIGGGDWSADRLLPDAVRAWQGGAVLQIRRPDATRPWQHVLDPLSGYLQLAERLWDGPSDLTAINFGPLPHEAVTVREVVTLARDDYGRGEIEYSEGCAGPHEASSLALETSRARHALGLSPRWPLREAVRRTMAWYRAQAGGTDARKLCDADLREFTECGA